MRTAAPRVISRLGIASRSGGVHFLGRLFIVVAVLANSEHGVIVRHGWRRQLRRATFELLGVTNHREWSTVHDEN